MTGLDSKDQFTVGFIRGPHGLTGEFKVESASGFYDHIAVLQEVTLRLGMQEKVYKVDNVSWNGTTFYMKLAGIDSAEDAAKLNRYEIRVPREYAKPLEKDEWYVEDLKQCSLIFKDKDGLVDGTTPIMVGSITDVLEGGASDLLEVSISESCSILADNIKKTASGKPRTVLIPMNKQFIGKVDVKNKTIELMHLWILE